MAGQRMSGQGMPGQGMPGAVPGDAQTAPRPAANAGRPLIPNRAGGVAAGKATRGVVRGIGGFLRPFGRVGGIVWLEVTGVFFALPVLVFTPTVWKTRLSWAHGPDHRTFLVSLGIVLLFIYLSVSSFQRARRK